MSLIDYITLAITRTSMPEGAICRIDYAYYLHSDHQAWRDNTHFRVGCELCGEHIVTEEAITEDLYDLHEVTAQHSMPMERSFIVPCEILNDRIGKDSIFIRLFISGSSGEQFTARSATINDSF